MFERIPSGVTAVVVASLLLGAILIGKRWRGYQGSAYGRALKAAEEYISICLLLLMLLVALLQVASRFSLLGSLDASWTEELALLAMVWLAFWTATVAARTGDHISLSFFYDLLSNRNKKYLDIFGYCVTIIVLSPVAWYGFMAARRAETLQTVTLGISVAAFAYAIPFAMALIIAHTIGHLIARVRS